MSAKRAYVIIPYAGEFQTILREMIEPSIINADYELITPNMISAGEDWRESINQFIKDADVIIAEVTTPNPNVFFELGFAIALSKPIILMSQKSGLTTLPFDLRDHQLLLYDARPSELMNSLIRLTSILQKISNYPERYTSTSDQVSANEVKQLKTTIEDLRMELAATMAANENLREQRNFAVQEINKRKTNNAEGDNYSDLMSEFKMFVAEQIGGIGGRVDQIYLPNIERANAEIDQLKAQNELLRLSQEKLFEYESMGIMKVTPFWKGRDFQIDEDLCFLVMPFTEIWSNDVWKTIDSAVRNCGMRCERADEQDERSIMDNIWDMICKARIVIADISAKNANVAYEIGLADVLGKDVIFLAQDVNDVPFDFRNSRLITYTNTIAGARKLTSELDQRLKNRRQKSN